jgi:glutathione gamma-glutamylcysteinyltransferase
VTIGFYQRPLPSSLLPFASNEGRKVFREALNEGGMEGYFSLAAQFQTQSEPAYCGPTTLAMILNSLALDPRKIWKGGWRYEPLLSYCCCIVMIIIMI